MLDAHTLSVSIDRPWQSLYEAFWRPEAFAEWASGLSQAKLTRDGECWRAEGPQGAVSIRFTDHNPFGIMDHWVALGDGREIYVPLRVLANEQGAEVQLTLFRQPDMDEDTFAQDAAWVRRDLLMLKALAER